MHILNAPPTGMPFRASLCVFNGSSLRFRITIIWSFMNVSETTTGRRYFWPLSTMKKLEQRSDSSGKAKELTVELALAISSLLCGSHGIGVTHVVVAEDFDETCVRVR